MSFSFDYIGSEIKYNYLSPKWLSLTFGIYLMGKKKKDFYSVIKDLEESDEKPLRKSRLAAFEEPRHSKHMPEECLKLYSD